MTAVQTINVVTCWSIIARRMQLMIGNAKMMWMPAVTSGRKNTVRICEWIDRLASLWLRPTLRMIEKRALSSRPSEICL